MPLSCSLLLSFRSDSRYTLSVSPTIRCHLMSEVQDFNLSRTRHTHWRGDDSCKYYTTEFVSHSCQVSWQVYFSVWFFFCYLFGIGSAATHTRLSTLVELSVLTSSSSQRLIPQGIWPVLGVSLFECPQKLIYTRFQLTRHPVPS